MCITSGIIAVYLLRKYYLVRNKFSLFMAGFFIIDSVGWFSWIYTYLLDIYETYRPIAIIPVVAAQIILLLFVFSVFKIHFSIRIISILIVVAVAIIYLANPDFLYLLNIAGMIVTILNIILFIMNWQKNEDIKSLGFANGLIIMSIGELLASVSFISLFIEGIFLVMTAAIWLITFSGLFEKMISEK